MGEARARFYAGNPDFELVGVADPTASRRLRLAEAFPGVDAYHSAQDMLAKRQADLIDICSPPVAHASQIRMALQTGCHVVCEKPMVTRFGDLRALVSLSQSVGRVLYAAHNHRFSSAVGFLKAMHDGGELGSVREGEMRVVRTGHARGVSDWRPDWRRDYDVAGGGILNDHGTHCIYTAAVIAGAWPSAVSCAISPNGTAHHAERNAALRMITGDIEWSINLTWDGATRSNSYAITGNRGVASVNDAHASVETATGLTEVALPVETSGQTHSAWISPMVEDLCRAIRDPSHAAKRLDEAVATARTLDAAYNSAGRGGGWIELEPDESPPLAAVAGD